MTTETITITETGCYLDNHRGHYIERDMIELAQGFGFIVGPFEQWALDTHDVYHVVDAFDSKVAELQRKEYPFEALHELADDALNWLNSGQGPCIDCGTSGEVQWYVGLDPETAAANYELVICRKCSGKGRGERIAGQNFPPIIPADHAWDWNDGDFGLYPIEDED